MTEGKIKKKTKKKAKKKGFNIAQEHAINILTDFLIRCKKKNKQKKEAKQNYFKQKKNKK